MSETGILQMETDKKVLVNRNFIRYLINFSKILGSLRKLLVVRGIGVLTCPEFQKSRMIPESN